MLVVEGRPTFLYIGGHFPPKPPRLLGVSYRVGQDLMAENPDFFFRNSVSVIGATPQTPQVLVYSPLGWG